MRSLRRIVLRLKGRPQNADCGGDVSRGPVPVDRKVITGRLKHTAQREKQAGEAAHVQFVSLEKLHGGALPFRVATVARLWGDESGFDALPRSGERGYDPNS